LFTVDRSSRVTAGAEFFRDFFLQWVEPFFQERSDLALTTNSFNDGLRVWDAKLATDGFDLLGRALIVAKLSKCREYDALK
jgi:hypothetical protein